LFLFFDARATSTRAKKKPENEKRKRDLSKTHHVPDRDLGRELEARVDPSDGGLACVKKKEISF
jgi:hypothetical protein